MELQPRQPSEKAPAHTFTGDVWYDGILEPVGSPGVRIMTIHFSPGARTRWHAHALGQTLYVTEGAGLVQSRGGQIERLHVGDVVRADAGEWHWHGAASDGFMTHLSLTEGVTEQAQLGDPVSDDEYAGRSSASS